MLSMMITSEKVPFRIQLNGIPLHLWTENNLYGIGRKPGLVKTVQVTEGRMFVEMDSYKPFKFGHDPDQI